MARTKTSSSGEMLVELRRDDALPIHRQLEQALREAVRSGRLTPDAPVPSSRALAAQLGVSRGVVVEAYEQLVAEGYLVSRPGGTTRVAPRATVDEPPRPEPRRRPAPWVAFRYGPPDVTEFPRTAWLRSVRRALTGMPSERLGYGDPRGVPEVRVALARYLNRVRGTAADPERLVMCGGFVQAIALLTRALRAGGARRIALEDPSEDLSPAIALDSGLEIAPIPVDAAGIDVAAVEASRADAVLVTAAHQFPVGGVLPAARRSALVRWAATTGALVLEDDYDAEYRYDREPIGAIQGLAPEHVVYIGSASKTLAPGLRLGWMVLPDRLLDRVVAAKRRADRASPVLEQLAFADFLERGEFDHHLRRTRAIYRRRRDALLGGLARHLPELEPTGASAGLHVLAWLPDDVEEAALLVELRRRGVGVDGLATYRLTPSARGGLIFGYANVTERAVEDGLATIAAALAHLRERWPAGRAIGRG